MNLQHDAMPLETWSSLNKDRLFNFMVSFSPKMSPETDFAEWRYANWVFVWLTEGVACFGQVYEAYTGEPTKSKGSNLQNKRVNG